MKFALHLALIFFVFFLCACGTKEEPVSRKSQLSSGFQMVEKEDYDGAIEYFQKLLIQDSHPHVKMALASAYAAKAGVKIKDLIRFVEPLQNKEFDFSAQSNNQNLLTTLTLFIQSWNVVPKVSESSRLSLRSAIETLKGVEMPGAKLYSAALRVVLFKSLIEQAKEMWMKPLQTQPCEPNELQRWSLKVFASLSEILSDLQGAFPRDQKKYQNLKQQLLGFTAVAEARLNQKDSTCAP